MAWTIVRSLKCAGWLAAGATAAAMGSCGGGGGTPNDAAMALIDFHFVDRALQPAAPTGTPDLPRNAQLLFRFSEEIDPGTVGIQTIRLRYGPQLATVPEGALLVDGNMVLFDPTRTLVGTPHPYGLEPRTQFVLDVPAVAEGVHVVHSRGSEPNHSALHTTFATGDGWLFDGVPPRLLGIVFEPDIHPVTGHVRGDGRFGLQFSEPMDPQSMVLGPPALPLTPETTIDVRYDELDPGNQGGGLAGAAVAGTLLPDVAGTTWWFEPTFSFGDNTYVFYVAMRQGLTDLAGHPLINPRSFGPYICDGTGRKVGKLLIEDFDLPTDADVDRTDADWAGRTPGELRGQAMTAREARIYGYAATRLGSNSGTGQYAALPDPLTGRDLNAAVPNVNPPTSQGRRVMFSFSEAEMGPLGTITAAAWGPDSNATFASQHSSLILRMGYQAEGSMTLAQGFRDNYSGSSATVYSGGYSIPQRANIGNRPGEPTRAHVGGYTDGACWPGGVTRGTWNRPLFDFTGFQPWPALTSHFDWDAGDPDSPDDRVFLFDVSATEGDTWQQMRTWFATTAPCSGALLQGYPMRRLYSTYEGETPNPATNLAGANATQNPEPSLCDMAFTVVRRITVAQSLFYGPAGAALPAAGGVTFGGTTDYLPAQLSPSVQAGGCRVEVEYQGATALLDRRSINVGLPFTAWTKVVDDCDGYPYLRWRLRLIGNLLSGQVPRVSRLVIPMHNRGG